MFRKKSPSIFAGTGWIKEQGPLPIAAHLLSVDKCTVEVIFAISCSEVNMNVAHEKAGQWSKTLAKEPDFVELFPFIIFPTGKHNSTSIT